MVCHYCIVWILFDLSRLLLGVCIVRWKWSRCISSPFYVMKGGLCTFDFDATLSLIYLQLHTCGHCWRDASLFCKYVIVISISERNGKARVRSPDRRSPKHQVTIPECLFLLLWLFFYFFFYKRNILDIILDPVVIDQFTFIQIKCTSNQYTSLT